MEDRLVEKLGLQNRNVYGASKVNKTAMAAKAPETKNVTQVNKTEKAVPAVSLVSIPKSNHPSNFDTLLEVYDPDNKKLEKDQQEMADELLQTYKESTYAKAEHALEKKYKTLEVVNDKMVQMNKDEGVRDEQ